MDKDSEFGSGSRLLEWLSSGREEVFQLGPIVDPCKKMGSSARAYIVGVVDHTYLATRLPLWLTLSSYASTTPAVLACILVYLIDRSPDATVAGANVNKPLFPAWLQTEEP
ncbi:hypothetical protein B296_00015720 [Ensete ventricosum]|uniref:Uncharacterized protein n=1 Tax=Ensete ventricosum TaxID=4639 RepID=A0A426YTF4_ENSVE|nr:hypothetical protein B296_00015720 [Ensete ventricosum]